MSAVPAVRAPEVQAAALAALGDVYDPELDEPITALGFVSSCRVDLDGNAEVRLRLPTPQCAPNFAFLMAADARSAVRRVPGVREVSVVLEDHYTGSEINAALARDQGFTGAFPGETTDDELTTLRTLFLRKALIARQAVICQSLIAQDIDPVQLRVGALPPSPDVARCLALREQLGIGHAPQDAAFVHASGEPVQAQEMARWLRAGRLVRTSLEANGGICRSLAQFRRGEVVR